jgi:hypothetical protein
LAWAKISAVLFETKEIFSLRGNYDRQINCQRPKYSQKTESLLHMPKVMLMAIMVEDSLLIKNCT